ncbi:unnamed protein product [Fraxinus pennsylvanica]|uniref:DUF547 domain-containing protein n=1 Tax=Fraxinus pennsylvanica TaxID=56036 RepID=A0AAD2DTG0_9LAMI|nr:unnamed protein product [Fraxinus pennsylvanica]
MGHLKIFEAKNRQLPLGEAQIYLKDEIIQLQKQLEDQIIVRSALEKAMNYWPLLDDPKYKSLDQPAGDLIKEIAVLELEVAYLEKYLLSMYRRIFSKRLSTLPTMDERGSANSETPKWMLPEFFKPSLPPSKESSVTFVPPQDSANKCNDILGAETLVDSGIGRSQSSLSQRSTCAFRTSPSQAVAEAVDLHHSLPLSMLERAQGSTSSASLAEQLGSSFPDHAQETPNWLSEEMIKCISTIYFHLSDSPLINREFSSAISHSSPISKFSPRQCEDNSWMKSPLYIGASKEFSGPFFAMVEVRGILRDSQRLNAIEDQLQKFRFLISRLAQVDPGKLKHEEKLAFWINVHNALVMHAFLVYGIPRGNLKRFSLVLKAAYNIGGQTVSIDVMQSSILGCRLPRPAQWLQSLFFPKARLKTRDSQKAYAIHHPETRLHFALCLGCQSDPSVRLYTPKKVFQELEIAKEEYIQSNVRLHKEQRLLVPKNVEYYVKEMGLYPAGIAEVIELSMLDSLRKRPQQGKLWKKIEWIPHNFNFRFLLSNELIK